MEEMGKKEIYPPLDRWRLDAVLEPDRKLWGLPVIAKALGLSVNKVRQLAKLDDVPIHQPPGCNQYFAWHSELVAWLKSDKKIQKGTNLEV